MNVQAPPPPRKLWHEFADVVALLLWQPRTALEVAALTERPVKTVYDKLNVLHHAGVVRVAGRRFNHERTTRTGAPAKVFAIQAKPFELDDTPLVRL